MIQQQGNIVIHNLATRKISGQAPKTAEIATSSTVRSLGQEVRSRNSRIHRRDGGGGGIGLGFGAKF